MNDIADTIRNRIEHEDNLISNRISWLVSSQAFLLTAFSICLNFVSGEKVPQNYAHMNHLVVKIIPLAGIACTILVSLGIFGGILAMADLKRRAEDENIRDLFYIHGHKITQCLGHAIPTLIPFVFLATWFVILFK